MDFLSILKALQRKLWVLISIPVFTVVCAFFFISSMDKKFKSTAQIATGFTTDDAVKLNDGSSNPFEISTNFTNIIESMNSIPVLTLVSYRLVLHDIDEPDPFRNFNPRKDAEIVIDAEKLKWAKDEFRKRLSGFKALNSVDEDDRILFEILRGFEYDYESIIKNLWIRRVSTSDFISVDFTSENSFLSALAVNAVCEEFIRYNKALKVDRSSESIEFLESLMGEKKRVLDERTAKLNDYKVSNNVFNYGAESESKISLIADYEMNKENESKKVNGLELSIASIESKIQGYGKLNQQEVVQVNQRIIDLRRKISDLNNQGADANKTEINKLRDDLQLEVSRLESINKGQAAEELKQLEKERDQLELELKISQSNLNTIEQTLRKMKYDVSGFATKEATLADLERNVQFASEDYSSVQDKFNTAKNKALVIGSSIRQTLQGQPSYEAEPSKALLLMALAGIGSFALCVMVLVVIEYLDFSIRILSRLERLTGLKALGSVNFIQSKGFNLRNIFLDKKLDKESEIFVHFLRKLRYEIQSSKSKVFLVTSTQVGAGKSFMIICLSYTLSLINKKVLIIDTNFRHNSLTKLLLANNERVKLLEKSPFGDEEKLNEDNVVNRKNRTNGFNFNEKTKTEEPDTKESNSSGPPQDAKSIIHSTEFSGVDIIGNVGGKDSPSEILAGRDFNEVINNLVEQYDYIFMEGPSLNEYSDTKELIDFADKVITVFGAEAVLNNHDKQSVQYLKSVKGKLLGTVLNRVQFKDLTV
jgi:polysaccharide biosynthesis transport protein